MKAVVPERLQAPAVGQPAHRAAPASCLDNFHPFSALYLCSEYCWFQGFLQSLKEAGHFAAFTCPAHPPCPPTVNRSALHPLCRMHEPDIGASRSIGDQSKGIRGRQKKLRMPRAKIQPTTKRSDGRLPHPGTGAGPGSGRALEALRAALWKNMLQCQNGAAPGATYGYESGLPG